MKKLRAISIAALCLSVAGFLLWRFVLPLPDWFVRVTGILMLAAVFTAVFSMVKIGMSKK